MLVSPMASLTYKRKKTGTVLVIKLEPLALEILHSYTNNCNGYLLPVLNSAIDSGSRQAISTTRQWIKTTNKWLRRIANDCKLNIDLTTYVTRHSWATIAKKLGYANELIAECLGHSYGNKITNIYLDCFEQDSLDNANRKVLSTILADNQSPPI
jgi:integrase/recombinase XerD